MSMITKPTAADAPDGFWASKDLDGTGRKWKYANCATTGKNLGDALASDEKFMDDFLGMEVDYLVESVRGEPEMFEAWEQHCRHAMNRANYETEQEWVTAYTEYAKKAPSDDIYHWAYKRVMDDVGDYWAMVRDLCSDDECDLRKEHPVIGVYSETYDAWIQLDEILGWCPTCGEPLCRGQISWGRDLQGNNEEVEIFVCGNCGAADPITGNDGKGFEAKWGRPFHLPFAAKETKNGEEVRSA